LLRATPLESNHPPVAKAALRLEFEEDTEV